MLLRIILSSIGLLPVASVLGVSPLYSAEITVDAGPFAGVGSSSDQAKVRFSSGYSFQLSYAIPVFTSFAVGPHIQLANVFINAKKTKAGEIRISSYDHKIGSLGLSLEAETAGWVDRLFVRASFGRLRSDLTVDESDQRRFLQHEFSDLTGSSFMAELGAFFDLSAHIGMSLSAISFYARLDQRGVQGKMAGEELDADGRRLSLTRSTNTEEVGLSDDVVQKSYWFRAAISLRL